ncbi:hypothetical protein AKJ41_03560 [candidate division MSBL1 archaeon SCGC-AAA259O05]|uniref:Uncharacterized protein n=1 Tax=candidate division MSBL1 archaeon SCGC-AAA259O05 TaxID=1698271 RepID=A0A133V3A6_9EURY|nr:hypothetical protein AKJ41_03560 [candidate division MSBL1 archaeon SCGC-AAA259O05]
MEEEFTTDDNARIDLAVFHSSKPLLAIEFEESYKWMRSRILYDAVKADRSGFKKLAILYPFQQRGLLNCWIFNFIENELEVKVDVVKPEKLIEFLREVKRKK